MYAEKYKLHEREKSHKFGALRSIELDVTNKCNMNCSFCYVKPFANRQEIPLDVLEKTAKEAYDMGVCHYILQGGKYAQTMSV